MAFGILKGIGMSVLGGAMGGVPVADTGSQARVSSDPEAQIQVTFERAGVDTEGCVLYRLRRVQEGRSVRVRAGLFWQSTAGEWTRFRPAHCVTPETKGRSGR